MSGYPANAPADLINLVRAISAKDLGQARDCYMRLTVTRASATGTICGLANAVASTVPNGPGQVMTFDVERTDGQPVTRWQVAIGRIIACMGNGDTRTAVAVADTLPDLDLITAGWHLAQMAAAVWLDASRRDAAGRN